MQQIRATPRQHPSLHWKLNKARRTNAWLPFLESFFFQPGSQPPIRYYTGRRKSRILAVVMAPKRKAKSSNDGRKWRTLNNTRVQPRTNKQQTPWFPPLNNARLGDFSFKEKIWLTQKYHIIFHHINNHPHDIDGYQIILSNGRGQAWYLRSGKLAGWGLKKTSNSRR